MANLFDDGLDEYVGQQEQTPTVPASVQTTTPQQQKSAEQEEIEKILATVRGIREIQGEMCKTMSELIDMTEKAQSLSEQLSGNIREAKSIYDDLLKNYTEELIIDEESFAKFEGIMQKHSSIILKNSVSMIQQSVTENLTGQFTEVISNKISELDSKMKASEGVHRQVLAKLKKEYEDSISNLKQEHGKLLSQTGEEQSGILIPKVSFWTLAALSMIIIVCGVISWIKFWEINDDAKDWVIFDIFAETIYIVRLVILWGIRIHHGNSDENEKNDKVSVFNVSLAKALYVMILTLSSTVYIVWDKMDVFGSPKLLLYLLPLAIASNTIWLFVRTIIYGIFKKE